MDDHRIRTYLYEIRSAQCVGHGLEVTREQAKKIGVGDVSRWPQSARDAVSR
jgi:hypothetical protein